MTREERIAQEVAELFGEFRADDEWRVALSYKRRSAYVAGDKRFLIKGKTFARHLFLLGETRQIRAMRDARKAARGPQPAAVCGVYPRRSARAAAAATPPEFRDVLIAMARSATRQTHEEATR